MNVVDWIKFHLAFRGFVASVEDGVIVLRFWLKDTWTEQRFNDWNEVFDFVRSI